MGAFPASSGSESSLYSGGSARLAAPHRPRGVGARPAADYSARPHAERTSPGSIADVIPQDGFIVPTAIVHAEDGHGVIVNGESDRRATTETNRA